MAGHKKLPGAVFNVAQRRPEGWPAREGGHKKPAPGAGSSMGYSTLRQTLQVALGQLRRRAARILRNHLLQNPLGLVGVAQTLLDIGKLEQRVRHLGVTRVGLADTGKGLAGTLQIALGQIHLAQPVLGIARVLAIWVLTQKGAERLIGLVEVL